MTKIEWVRGDDGSEGLSWNALRARPKVPKDPKFAGKTANHCEHVNGACKFCYAESQNPRAGGHAFIRQNRDLYTFEVDERKLLEPLKRKKPTRIFVESMSDAFGEWWPDHFIDKLYAVMALCPQHTFINLSKRPERRQKYLSLTRTVEAIYSLACKQDERVASRWQWPLPNVIEGISVSCQPEAVKDVPVLLATQAAIRCVSAEPLLGPIDFTAIKFDYGHGLFGDALKWHHLPYQEPRKYPALDWVIVGGESGPKARPMHPQWARDIRDQCKAAGVAFFFKQWGEWAPTAQTRIYDPEKPIHVFQTGEVQTFGGPVPTGIGMRRVGKKAAGRLLDGVEHNGFPALRADRTTRAA
jgi:protein gp37